MKHLSPNPNVEIRAKMESHNPGWSVKDRPAYNMITQAMKRWELKPGDTIIEATAWNMWIWLAFVWKQLGLNVILTMPENSTAERVQTMKGYGAEVMLTPAEEPFEYCRDLATQLAKEKWYVNLDQFSNEDNRKAHYKTTWPEIWEQTWWNITHFVSVKWTTGIIVGTGKFLKEKKNDITIVWSEPGLCDCIPWTRNRPVDYVPDIYDPTIQDISIEGNQAWAEEAMRLLWHKEGIFCGISAWLWCWGAMQIAKQIESWCIVFIVCDNGSRYISTWVYDR